MSLPAATWEDIGTLTPWDRNPRDNERAINKVAASIARFGFGAPIIARAADRVVIAGHTRLLAAKKVGLDKIPVRFLDLDPDEAAALNLADNKLGEVAEWNNDMLADILQGLEASDVDLDGLGWTDDELDTLLNIAAPTTAENDETPPPPAQVTFSLPGTVYELGPHRLVCGDATMVEAWDGLLPGNEMLDAVWTDPPHLAVDETIQLELLDTALGHAFHACEAGAVWYIIAPAGPGFYAFATALKKLEVWRDTLVWLKDARVMGRSDYHHRHEAIFYGWKPGAVHYWCGKRNLDTIFEVTRPRVNRDHPTMKPIELIERCLENSTVPGNLVGDPFAGSGTTLIACAITGRRARLIELDPSYCDVIRRRWTAHARANGVDPGTGYLDPDNEQEE